uniref:Extracellular domains-containing protein CG31004 n=1 Tax=Lygus hesperus TaxID=30085 RepID=A0A146LTJ4_LYGHE
MTASCFLCLGFLFVVLGCRAEAPQVSPNLSFLDVVTGDEGAHRLSKRQQPYPYNPRLPNQRVPIPVAQRPGVRFQAQGSYPTGTGIGAGGYLPAGYNPGGGSFNPYGNNPNTYNDPNNAPWDDGRTGPPTIPINDGSIYTITPERLANIRKPLMYWFFDKGGDSGNGDYQTDIHASNTQVHKNFNFQLPFFGFRFNYTRISLNGYLEFSDPPELLTYPLQFPSPGWPKVRDPSFIGIWYSKCRISPVRDPNRHTPGIYFRMERDLWGRTDRFGVEFRERLKWDLREGIVGSDSFEPKHAAVITWKNVTFSGGNDASISRVNTFQLVLATNEVITYAMFNYDEVQWTSHTEAGGDPTSGEGGTPAFVGFNAGNGTRSFVYEPYSQDAAIRNLKLHGWGNGKPGRHLFRIDEQILIGNCNKDIAKASLNLHYAPESGNMLGGTIVNITGPCFTATDDIVCRFDYTSVKGTVIDSNRAVCVQPYLNAEGYIPFEISINSGFYTWKGKYFVETPATAEEKITFNDDSVHQTYPRQIVINWNKYNLTTNLAASVQISIYGYKEVTTQPQFMFIDLIEAGVTNTGYYSIDPSNYRNRNNVYDFDSIMFGFIQINLTVPTTYNSLTITPVIWSRPIPLGWYFAPQYERIYGTKWPHALCDKWLMYDRYLKNFAADVSSCPCKLEQALNDKGRYQPDPDCDMITNRKCFYHKGARHCVQTGSPNIDGSEQQCCYDKNNFLMLSYDQMWGSSPKRSHNLGYLPWNEANKVPTLSQWFHDIIPTYVCCMWQEEQSVGCEALRFERRPSQDCVGYQAPYVGTVFGDPHFITFDNLEYTFNGQGEFVLVRSDSEKYKLDVQGRFERIPPNIFGESEATLLTSVAATVNNSAIIEVRLRPRFARWRYALDVFADSRRIYFDRPALRSQHFRGVTVYQGSRVLNQSEVIIMFDTGVGVEVVENHGYMAARVYLPWTYINQTRGLLGNWSFDKNDDFTLPDGSIVNVGNLNDFEAIHRQFGMKWILEDKVTNRGRALFVQDNGRKASFYTNTSFVPEFKKSPQEILPPNRQQDVKIAEDLCAESYQCRYDYAVSLNKDLAYWTLDYFSTYTSISEKAAQRVISCGVLETPQYGRKSNFFFIPGTKVVFECNQNYILVGDQKRVCSPQGKWEAPEYGYTECLPQVEYDIDQVLRTSAIIAGVLLPLLLGLACIGAYIYRRNNKDNKSSEESWRYNNGRTKSTASLDTLLNSRRKSVASHPATVTTAAEPLMSERQESELQRAGRPATGVRPFDGVYTTNEPLPNRPNVDFEDKVWGLEDDEGDGGSYYTDSSFSSPSTSRGTSKKTVLPPPPPLPPNKEKQRLSSVETDIF